MSNEEKRTILYDAVARAYNAIAETPGDEMKSERFGNFLYNICHMENIAAGLVGGEEDQREVTGAVGDQSLCPGHSEAGTAKESLAVEAAAPEQPAGVGETEEPTTYTKEEVKSALAKARVKGVNAVAVLRQVGADSFQTLTSNKYAEVMRIIEQELANAS